MSDRSLNLLLVEDEDDFRDTCARWMQRKGHTVKTAPNAAEGLRLCEREQFEVAVCDMNMPGMSGIEFLERLRDNKNDMEVIILTGQGTIETAVSAMKMGACDFLTKPCALGDVEHHCFLARDRGRLRKENQQLKAIITRDRPAVELIGESPPMRNVVRMINRAAPTDQPVLIQGESGTGKEIVARAIQEKSRRSDRPFVTINCAALPEQLVESELFGHQRGSFTGAMADKFGLFEIADQGTLFIDEVGELPLSLQPKLLRVLEDGSMRRIGSHKERVVDVRIIAATNCDLADAVDKGNFREDLYYRINVLMINLPPLRARCGDIDRLIDHYLPRDWHIDPAARRALNRYEWPGNIRQLINNIQRATILSDGYEITLDDLPLEIAACDRAELINEDSDDVDDASHVAGLDAEDRRCVTSRLDDVIRSHVLDVLQQQHGNKARAARELGIHRRKLYRLLERFEGQAVGETDS